MTSESLTVNQMKLIANLMEISAQEKHLDNYDPVSN